MEQNIFSSMYLNGYKISQARNESYCISASDNEKISLSCREFDPEKELKLDQSDSMVSIYAESLVLPASLKCSNIIISANNMTCIEEQSDLKLDVSGDNGKRANSKVGKEANEVEDIAKEACDAGNVFLYVENIGDFIEREDYFTIDARGGVGKPGITGEKTSGNGGSGGNVQVLISHPKLILEDELSRLYREDDLIKKKAAINKFNERMNYSTAKEMKNVVEKLANLVEDQSITTSQINAYIEKELKDAPDYVRSCKSWCRNQLSIYTNVEGGVRGAAYGEEISLGSNGSPGTKKCAYKFSNIDKLFAIHPLQCAMLFNRAKLEYMFLDPIDFDQRHQIYELFSRLYYRTVPFMDIDDKYDCPKEYEQINKKNSILENIQFFKRLNQESSKYLYALNQGLDIFGYRNNYVQLMPITRIRDEFLKPLCENFIVINDAYKEYTRKENDHKKKVAKARDISSAISLMLSQDDIKECILQNEIEISAKLIEEYGDVIPKKREMAEKSIEGYKEALSKQCGFEVEDLLHSMSTIAFCPTSSAMYLTQAAELAYSGYNDITDDRGGKVRKEYLIRKVTKVKSDLKSLAEGYKSGKSGSLELDDPEAGKLLVEQEKLNQQLEDFYSHFPRDIEKVKDAFKDYVDTVISRNTEILNYNTGVEIILQIQDERTKAKKKIKDLSEDLRDEANENLENVEELVSYAYYSSRDDLLRAINLAEKSYRLHTLALGNRILPPNLRDINNVSMNLILARLNSSLFDSEITHPGAPNDFEDVHYKLEGPILKKLKKKGETDFEIDPYSMDEHTGCMEFDYKYWKNIRIKSISPYIVGIRSRDTKDPHVHIRVTHGANDSFINNERKKIDLIHEPITATFSYDVDNPQKVNDHAEFLFFDNRGDKVPLIGPFTKWTIKIEDFKKMDLTGVKILDVVFTGTHYS